ncbi:MAG: ArsA family ATPase [Myxococcota bacterium]|nr:ArsA family ATPase [Myxococcota bacterium]
MQQRPSPPLSRRFHLVTGKGGVGKSTVAATLGLYFARRGERTLICEMDPRAQLSTLFSLPSKPGEIVRLHNEVELWGVNIDLEAAILEYGTLKLRFQRLSRLFFDNPLTRTLINLLPGVSSLIMLGKAFHHERERVGRRFVWDRVIIDAPATGHSLALISLPRMISEVIRRGNLYRENAEMWALLQDAERSAVHVVTLPERLPLSETLELWEALERDLGVARGHLFLNQTPSSTHWPRPSPSTSTSLSEGDLSLLAELSQLLERRHREYERAQVALENFTLPCVPIELPRLDAFSLEGFTEIFADAVKK